MYTQIFISTSSKENYLTLSTLGTLLTHSSFHPLHHVTEAYNPSAIILRFDVSAVFTHIPLTHYREIRSWIAQCHSAFTNESVVNIKESKVRGMKRKKKQYYDDHIEKILNYRDGDCEVRSFPSSPLSHRAC